jgi:hypothetical protein
VRDGYCNSHVTAFQGYEEVTFTDSNASIFFSNYTCSRGLLIQSEACIRCKPVTKSNPVDIPWMQGTVRDCRMEHFQICMALGGATLHKCPCSNAGALLSGFALWGAQTYSICRGGLSDGSVCGRVWRACVRQG